MNFLLLFFYIKVHDGNAVASFYIILLEALGSIHLLQPYMEKSRHFYTFHLLTLLTGPISLGFGYFI